MIVTPKMVGFGKRQELYVSQKKQLEIWPRFDFLD